MAIRETKDTGAATSGAGDGRVAVRLEHLLQHKTNLRLHGIDFIEL